MLKDEKLERAVRAVKNFKRFSLVFTDNDIRRTCLHDRDRLVSDYQAVHWLVKNGQLKKVYRVYSSDEPSQYVDYSKRGQIPFNGYAYYLPTGEEFFVSKYTLPEVFYQFI